MISLEVVIMIISKFRDTMHDLRMSNQTEIARLCGLSRQTINDLWHSNFKGKEGIQFETLDKLCRTFNLQVSDIIEYIPDEK